MALIPAKQIGGLTLAVDPKKLDKTVVLSGQNFVMDINGPKSGFGFTRFYLDLTENDFVTSIELGNEIYYFAHNEDDAFCNVYKVDYATRQYIYQFTIPQIYASQERKRHPWTIALVGGLYYVNHLSFGIYEYNIVTGDWYDRTSTIHTNLGNTNIYGITQSAGRAIYLTSANAHWSAIDDATDVTPSTITGAGFQSLALIGSPTQDYEYKGIYPVADGFLTFTQIGIMKSTIIDSINPFRHDPLTSDYIPFNQKCIVQLTKSTLVILTPIGLFSTDGKGFTPWQPLMSEYLKDVEIPTFSLNEIGQVQLYYDVRREWFFISISKTRNVNFFTQAFALYVPISEWGSFDYSHRGFVTIDEFGDGSKLLPGFIDANGKLAVFTDSPSNIDIAAREASGVGEVGLSCSLDQVTNKVINGDFTTNTDSWTKNGDGTIASVSGELEVVYGTAVTNAQQNITLVSGRTYKLTWTAREVSTAIGVMRLLNAIDAAITVDSTTMDAYEYIFTAETTTLEVYCRSDTGTVYFDDVVLTEYCAPNLLTHPENFGHVDWLKAWVTIGSNSAIAPDGSLSAEKIICTGTVDPYLYYDLDTGAVVLGKTFTFAIWAWIDEGQPTEASLFIFEKPGVADIGQKALTLTTTPTRYFITHTFTTTTTETEIRIRLDLKQAPASGDYLYAWGAQLTETAELQDYISEWDLERLPANEIFYAKNDLQYPTVLLEDIPRVNSVWQMDALNVSHEELNILGIPYPVLPGFYEIWGLRELHSDTQVAKYDMPDYIDAGTHDVVSDRITESRVEIAVFGYGKQLAVESALNSEIEVGLFRLTDEMQTGQFTEINEAFIGMEDSTGDDFSNEDYLLDSAQDIFVDYMTESEIVEDWGFSATSGSEYTQFLIGTIDGNSIFEDAILELEEVAQHGKTKHCVGAVSGIYLKLHIDATGIGQSFHLKEVEFTGILAGRL